MNASHNTFAFNFMYCVMKCTWFLVRARRMCSMRTQCCNSVLSVSDLSTVARWRHRASERWVSDGRSINLLGPHVLLAALSITVDHRSSLSMIVRVIETRERNRWVRSKTRLDGYSLTKETWSTFRWIDSVCFSIFMSWFSHTENVDSKIDINWVRSSLEEILY